MATWEKYQKNTALTSHPIHVTIMGIEKAIQDLGIVLESYEKMQFRAVEREAERAQQMLYILVVQLDKVKDFDEDIRMIYNVVEWCADNTKLAHSGKNIELIKKIIPNLENVLEGLRKSAEAWKIL